jgi:Fe-S cluster assembly scaffold protein SufB
MKSTSTPSRPKKKGVPGRCSPDDQRYLRPIGHTRSGTEISLRVGAQYESEMVYHSIQEHLAEKGVIFKSIENGLRDHPDLFENILAPSFLSRIINLQP